MDDDATLSILLDQLADLKLELDSTRRELAADAARIERRISLLEDMFTHFSTAPATPTV